MAYSLRLPDSLDAQARQRSGRMGISLNSLICVALDAYLRSPVPGAGSPVIAAPWTPKTDPTPPVSNTGGKPQKTHKPKRKGRG
jgi:hypothetical protein